MKFKVGDKVRVREDLVVGEYYDDYMFAWQMEEYKGKIFTIMTICNNNIYFLEEVGFSWTDEMLEEVKEDKMEKTFREVIADIKEGEVWESLNRKISMNEHKQIFIDGSSSLRCFDSSVKYKLQRKEYTFEEAFKAYEEGKEIEDYNKVKYKKIDGVDCYKFEWDKDFCTRAHEDDYWLGFKEIRGKWYIND